MIIDPTTEQAENLKLNVYLKDGRQFLNCNITSQPFGSKEKFVAIWQDNNVHMFPMSEVREVVMTFEIEKPTE